MGNTLQLVLNYGFPLLLLMFAYFVGSWLERKHFAQLGKREADVQSFPVLTTKTLPPTWQPNDATLMMGSVVVSLDYFKRIIAGLKGLVGGRIKTYEPLLDRARREAQLRLVEQAKTANYDALINVRLETSRLASARGGNGTAGVEILAFGTAIRYANTLPDGG